VLPLRIARCGNPDLGLDPDLGSVPSPSKVRLSGSIDEVGEELGLHEAFEKKKLETSMSAAVVFRFAATSDTLVGRSRVCSH